MQSLSPDLISRISSILSIPTEKDIQQVGQKIQSLRRGNSLPQSSKEISMKRLKKGEKTKGKWRIGRWSEEQMHLYHIFTYKNLRQLKDRRLRKGTKIFLRMSRSIKTRSPEQCRSHHLKFLSSHQIDLNYQRQLKLCGNKHLDQVLIRIRKEVEQVEVMGRTDAVIHVYRWKNQNRFCFVVDEKSVPAYDGPQA